MSHAIRMHKALWERVQGEAERRIMKPTQLVMLAVRRELGLESGVISTKEVLDGPSDGADSRETLGEDEYSPLAGNLGEIRLWQAKLEQAQTEYEGYRNGVSEDDWEMEARSDYVVDCVGRMDEARDKLRALVPIQEEV